MTVAEPMPPTPPHAGAFVIRARGQSMRPSLPDGAWVLIERKPASALRLGDVVFAEHGRGQVLHRFVFRSGTSLWLKGDRNAAHQRISQHHVVGRAVAWCPVDADGPRAWIPIPTRQWVALANAWGWWAAGLLRARSLMHYVPTGARDVISRRSRRQKSEQ